MFGSRYLVEYLAGTGPAGAHGTANITEVADTLTGVGVTGVVSVGTANITEVADTLTGAGVVTAGPQYAYPIADITTDSWLPYRRNLLTYTEAFDNAAWTPFHVSVATGVADPVGGTAADTLVEDSTDISHYVSCAASLTASLDYTLSVYAKPHGRSWILLYLVDKSGGTGYAYFNVMTGTIGTTSGATAAITSAAGGFYRCSIMHNAGTGSSPTSVYYMASPDGATISYLGSGAAALDLWGAQLEQASALTAYQPVLTTAAPTLLYPEVDEASANAADYIYSPDNPTTQECELKFGNLTTPVAGDHTLDYQLQAVGLTTAFRLTYMCGTTQIDQWTESVTVADGLATRSHTVLAANTASISDHTNMRIRIRASA